MVILTIENITLGNIQNLMVFVASMITTGGVIGGFVYKLFTKALHKQLEPFNKRIDETIQNNNKRFDELTRIVDFNDIDAVRNRIVAFENLCRLDVNNDDIKLHQYKTYFKDEDKWKLYHDKYPELNGEINVAIESIHNHYEKAKF